MKQEAVKYLIGLKLAHAGFRNFAQLASRLQITPQYVSLIVNCLQRPPKYQKAIARLCRCEPEELFREYTHPDLKESA